MSKDKSDDMNIGKDRDVSVGLLKARLLEERL